MIYPESLKLGDYVGLIAPSGCINNKKLELAVNVINMLGLKPIIGQSCYEKYGYFAGEDYTRAEDINFMFKEKIVRGIFCIRGGYGSQRIIDKINWDIIKTNPKLFMGYSDITVIHNMINQKCGFITYHSPMLGVEFCKPDLDLLTLESFFHYVFLNPKSRFNLDLNKCDIETIVKGNISGVLTGGNLSVITSSLGTDYEICTDNKVLFLEDIGEEPYKIDRKLNQLKNAKKLDKIKGVILGYWTNCNSSIKDSFNVNQVLYDFFKSIKKPCIAKIKCGHNLPNITIPLGANINIAN